ncbi:MAG TPA: conjugal transfer protein TrbL family protein [Candidatus Dormibacteraeota bacterium]|nr:conjugal transfer protein TrbL family protein [Candidatus Dormibacteraeota bacterium]
MDQLFGEIQSLLVVLGKLLDILAPFQHPASIVVLLLNDSVGLLDKVWFDFVLSTKDFETSGDFIANATIKRFEPKVQIVSNAALVLVAMWASYRIMWGHGLRTQYSARILLPRLFMGAVLINFSLPLFQAVVDITNTLCKVIQGFASLDSPADWLANSAYGPSAGIWEIVTTAILAVGYDVLAVTYLVRYAILIVLAITAPIAGLLFTLPETHHISKQWASNFTSNLLMQPAQLFVIAVGFGLEKDGTTPVHHLFALASLLLVFKVPGALGGAEKVAHKLQSTVDQAFHHLEHAIAKA